MPVMPFAFEPLDIPDVILITPKTFADDRGFFRETHKRSEFKAAGINEDFVQGNFSHSTRDTLRGMHFQRHPHAQGKLVQVLGGKIYDVAFDLREGSPTQNAYVGVTLDREGGQMLYVPPGFAHGFVVLSETADVIYQVTDEYAPETEGGFAWNDSQANITWPISHPVLSERDTKWPPLKNCQHGFAMTS